MTAVLMEKTISGLQPIDDLGRERLRKIKLGDLVTADIKQPRNVRRLQLYWALIQKVYENQQRFKSPENLSDALKVYVGHCEALKLRDGTIVQAPKSIAFANMEEPEFAMFLDRVIDVVATEIIPNLDRTALRDELETMCGVRT